MFAPRTFAAYIFFVMFNGSNQTLNIPMKTNFYIGSNTGWQYQTTFFFDYTAGRPRYIDIM